MADVDRQQFANEAEKALAHPLVVGAIDELLENLGADHDAVVRYGISKVAHYAATVARAQASGPRSGCASDLRMSDLRTGDYVEFTADGASKVGDSRPGTVHAPYPGADVVDVRHEDGHFTGTVFSWWLRKARRPRETAP